MIQPSGQNQNDLSGVKHNKISFAAAQMIFWPIFIAGLTTDIWTKTAVFGWLTEKSARYSSVIDGFFRLVMVENRGAAWGMAFGRRVPLIIISIAALIVVLGIVFFQKKPNALVTVSLAMLAAGICGNLYDRLFNDGKVRDFLDFYYSGWHFPAFNIADSMLTIAVGLLILTSILHPQKKD